MYVCMYVLTIKSNPQSAWRLHSESELVEDKTRNTYTKKKTHTHTVAYICSIYPIQWPVL